MAVHEIASEKVDQAPLVLLVDNDPDIAELVTAILTDDGYEVAAL